ncbi:MAG: hypothetical protein KAH22_06985 [Thiotrichaceae bacterium]|nr:hypothetical protein [Thiotrichaceae bacterium]
MKRYTFKKTLTISGLFLIGMSQFSNTALANWNSSGCNNWPEWTPMYWMEKMMDDSNDCDTMQSYYQGVNAAYARSAIQQNNANQGRTSVPYSALSAGINGNELLSQYPASAFRRYPIKKYQKKSSQYGYPMAMPMNQYGRGGFPMMGQDFNPMGSRTGFGSGIPMANFGSPMNPMGGSKMPMGNFGSPMSSMGGSGMPMGNFGSPMSPMGGFGSPMSPMGMGGFGSPFF